MMMNEAMTEREKAFYKEGYHDGRDDAIDIMWAVMDYVKDHPNCDCESPTGQARILAVAEKRLRAKGSKMTIAPHNNPRS